MKIKANKNHRQQLEEEVRTLYEQLQKVCNHLSIRLGGGEAWECYPDHGTHPFYLRCTICQLTGKYPSELGTIDRMNWDLLEAKILYEQLQPYQRTQEGD